MTVQANVLTRGQWATHRIKTGAPVTADAAMTTIAAAEAISQLAKTKRFTQILVGARLAGGAAPTAVLEVYCPDKDDDGFFLMHTTAALADGAYEAVTTCEHRIFVRVKTIANNPTSLKIKLSPVSGDTNAVG